MFGAKLCPGKLALTRMDLTPSRFGGKGTRVCHWSGDYQTIILEPDWFKRSSKRTQYNVLTLKIGAKVGRYKRGCGARLSHLHRSIAARRLSLPPKHCRQPPTLRRLQRMPTLSIWRHYFYATPVNAVTTQRDEALSTPFHYDDIPNWRPESSNDLIIFTSFYNLKFGVSLWSLTKYYFALKCFVMNLSDGSCTNFEGRMSVWMANRLKETQHLEEVIDSFM